MVSHLETLKYVYNKQPYVFVIVIAHKNQEC